MIGSAVAFAASLTGTNVGDGEAQIWKGLILLLAAVLIVRRVLARPTVTIQSIYGALSAYIILGLMFAALYATIYYLAAGHFFADGQPANTQTFQYFSFTTLTTLGYGDFVAASEGGRAVAVMEALTGQIFLATLVARLVAAFRAPSRQAGDLDPDAGTEGEQPCRRNDRPDRTRAHGVSPGQLRSEYLYEVVLDADDRPASLIRLGERLLGATSGGELPLSVVIVDHQREMRGLQHGSIAMGISKGQQRLRSHAGPDLGQLTDIFIDRLLTTPGGANLVRLAIQCNFRADHPSSGGGTNFH